MKIIYYGYSGVHSAAVAAAIHLGKIQINELKIIKPESIPFFGSRPIKFHLKFIGTDFLGNDVYILGVGHELQLVPRAIKNFLNIYDININEIKLINTLAFSGKLTRVAECLACVGFLKVGNFLAKIAFKYDCVKLTKSIDVI